MTTIDLKRVGNIALTDLIGLCPEQGDGVPYPLWRTRRDPYWGEIEQSLPPIAQRLDGELASVREWVETYARADIWVECRVKAFSADIDDIRIVAHRAGEAGFIATQRPTGDVADVYRLSALDVGAAVAGLAGLKHPGTRPEIAIPGFLDNFTGGDTAAGISAAKTLAEEEDCGFSIRDTVRSQNRSVRVQFNDVLLLGTVQSRCDPLRLRAVDWSRDVAVWLRLKGDGDYIYTPERDHAVPLSAQALRARIDQLIGADVATLRRRRGLA